MSPTGWPYRLVQGMGCPGWTLTGGQDWGWGGRGVAKFRDFIGDRVTFGVYFSEEMDISHPGHPVGDKYDTHSPKNLVNKESGFLSDFKNFGKTS